MDKADQKLAGKVAKILTGVEGLLRQALQKPEPDGQSSKAGEVIGAALREVFPEEVRRVIVDTLEDGAEKEDVQKQVIYTDGSCLDNPGGAGGWAYVSEEGAEQSGAAASTTNNRMELRAILEALRAAEEKGRVTIYSDSKYAVNTSTQNWDAQENLDLLSKVWAEVEKREVSFQYVPGHEGHDLNEKADDLAREAATGKRSST